VILYEYECLGCKAKFQKAILKKDHIKIICPSCKKTKVKKLWAKIVKADFVLKSCRDKCNNCAGCSKK